jgi:hypothetical protein
MFQSSATSIYSDCTAEELHANSRLPMLAYLHVRTNEKEAENGVTYLAAQGSNYINDLGKNCIRNSVK